MRDIEDLPGAEEERPALVLMPKLTVREKLRACMLHYVPLPLSRLVSLTGVPKQIVTSRLNDFIGREFINLAPGQADPVWYLVPALRKTGARALKGLG